MCYRHKMAYNQIHIQLHKVTYIYKQFLLLFNFLFVNQMLERPHPTDVGWGFYGLAPVKPRQSSYGYSDMVLQLLIRRIKATGLYQRKCPSIPVHPYTCNIILLIRARGLSEEKLFVVRIPGRLISYILCKSMFVNQN